MSLAMLPWKAAIKVNTEEAIGKSIWLTGCHDIEASEVLWRIIKKGDLAVDIGANVGYMVSIMAFRCGSSGKVLAFEPHPELYKILEDNIILFQSHKEIGQISIFNAALSDKKGKAFLTPFRTDNWGVSSISDCGENNIPVATTTLDDISQEAAISVLKIDVEGHELKILEGAKNLLKNKKIKHIIYENNSITNNVVHRYLAEYGFSIYYISYDRKGVILIPNEENPALESNITLNYLATLYPDEIIDIFKRRGWDCLRNVRIS